MNRKSPALELRPESDSFNPSQIRRPTLKRRRTLIGILFILMFFCASSGFAKSLIDYQGLHCFYGSSEWTEFGPPSSEKYEWINISYLAGKNITPWLSFETSIGPGLIMGDGSNDSKTVEFRCLLNFHSDYFFLKLGGGAAYLSDSEEIQDLASSQFFAIASGSLGISYQLRNGILAEPKIEFAYSVEHLSDPTKEGKEGDTGLNVGTIKLFASWTF